MKRLCFSHETYDEFHLWGLNHAPFGYKYIALTVYPYGQKVGDILLMSSRHGIIRIPGFSLIREVRMEKVGD